MKTIAVVGVGDMGSAVGRAAAASGHRIVTDLTGRSGLSRTLAERAGFEDLGSLEALVGEADVMLSILPPAAAAGFADRVLEAIRAAGATLVYADCNAVSPDTVGAIGRRFAAAGVPFVDVGIVGPPPRPERGLPTRFYVCGGPRHVLEDLHLADVTVHDLGAGIGRASAIKMVYASLNKGINALCTAALMAADRLGVRAELFAELEASQSEIAARMQRRVPYLASAAERFVGEMREIAATYASVGVTPRFHEGAQWLYASLADSALGAERRATEPDHRSLDEALAAFSATSRDI